MTASEPTIQILNSARAQFADLPPEAIIKTVALRSGLRFSKQALDGFAKQKAKSYFIFSFDHVTQDELSEQERHAVPEEIALTGGPWELKRTIVSVRVDPKSPLLIDVDDHGAPVLKIDDQLFAQVATQKIPDYYDCQLENGKPVSDITPTIEWGYLIYITAFRLCQYWGKKEECQFCDINENYRQQKKQRSYTGVKDPEQVVESLRLIEQSTNGSETMAYTVTGGSITTELNGLKECEFYARYAAAIESAFPGRWIGKAVVQALPLPEVQELKKSGYTIYHPNYEVWEKKLFEKICPGKESYVGWQEWMDRIVASAEVFGPENVIPNFVAGVEMAKPYGYQNVDEAIASTQSGLEYFMSKGISPRFTLWCPEPLTVLGKDNSAPPLEYFLKLLRVYRDTHSKYNLPVPPGYGPAGAGKAVFSVSAFMDVLGM
ncbi:MAG: radical SAM protein [Deltaproteobacteria bacterium]|nr:radical SAM protein [Deltaproteobacteria bacterium]